MTERSEYAPLLGDNHGRYRILILGNSGSGKSTLSVILSNRLGIERCSLDRLYWNPGWKETPTAEFRALVQEFMDRNSSKGWIVDGNYTSKVGTIVQNQATDIIWLDPPLLLYFPRIFVRTIKRWWGLEENCSPGCGETFRDIFLSRKSILWFCLTYHFVLKRRNGELMSRIGIGFGADVKSNKMRRIGGWGGELNDWLRKVEIMVRKKP